MKFEMYRQGQSGPFSFNLVDDQGNAILQSGEYDTQDACTEAIRSTIESLREPDRFQLADDGTFEVVDANGTLLAKSDVYAADDARTAAITSLQNEVAGNSDFDVTLTTTRTRATLVSAKDVDFASFYDFSQSSHSGEAGFDPYQNESDEQFYFLFNGPDGTPILFSRSFPTIGKRDARIRSVIKEAPKATRYERMDDNDKPFFIIKASNGTEIARSRPFDTEADMESAIAYVMGQAPTFEAAYPAPEKRKRSVNEYDLSQPSTTGEKGFDPFRSEKNSQYYFHYNDDQGQPVLYSEGYSSSRSRNNGIRSVIKNSPIRDRYEIKPEGDQFYVSLKAGNRQEIARTRSLSSQAEAETIIAYLIGQLPTYAETYKVVLASTTETSSFTLNVGATARGGAAEIEPDQSSTTDDYDLTQPSTSGAAGFERFVSDKNSESYFHFNDADGQALFYSEGYTSDRSRDNGVQSVIKNSIIDERFEMKEDENGHYFALKAGNRQEIGRSRYFANAGDRDAALAYFQRNVHQSASEYGIELDVPAHLKPAPLSRSGEELSTGGTHDNYDLVQAGSSSEPGFDRFTSDQNGESYFHINDAEGQPYFYSEGYSSDRSRDNGVQSVIKNSIIEERFEMKEDEDGHYFVLKAGNRQEIGRSRYFANAGDRDAALAYFQRSVHQSASEYGIELDVPAHLKPAPLSRSGEELATSRTKDNYYLTQTGSSNEPGFDRFYSGTYGGYFFHFNDDNGQPLIFSESYSNEPGRDNGIQSVIKNGLHHGRYEYERDDKGYYFVIKAGNHQEIARSRYFPTKGDAEAAVGDLRTRLPLYAGMYGVSLSADNIPADLNPHQGYMDLGAYASTGQARAFDTYQDPETGLYYWVYLDENGEPMFVSPGYASEAERDAGIKAAIDHIGDEGNYELVQGPTGWYYVLRDKEGNVLSMSRPYESEEAAKGRFNWLMTAMPAFAWGDYAFNWATGQGGAVLEDTVIKDPELDPNVAVGISNAYNGYVNMGNYESQLEPGKEGYDTYYDEETGKYYWVYLDDTHQPLFVSPGYDTAEARDTAIKGSIDHIGHENRYKLYQSPDGYFYYDLQDEAGQVIARSRPFTSKERAEDRFGWIFAALPAFAFGGYFLDWGTRRGTYETPAPVPLPEPLEPEPVDPVPPVEEPSPEPDPTPLPPPVGEDDDSRRGGWPWWIWLLLALLLLFLAWLLFSQCDRGNASVGGADKPAVTQPVPPATGGDGTNGNNPGGIIGGDSTNAEGQGSTGILDSTNQGGTDLGAPASGTGEDVGTGNDDGTSGAGGNNGPSRGNDDDNNNRLGELVGPDAAALGLRKKGYAGKLAEYLASPNSTFPSRGFILPGENFAFDKHYLMQPARRIVMDPNQIAKVLKAYPDAQIEIIGYRHVTEQEMVPDTYINPEAGGMIDLAKLRARCLYRKLNAVGIPFSRMTMSTKVDRSGPADAPSRRVEIRLMQR